MLNTIFMPELDSADYHEKQLRKYGITEINESTWNSDESGKDTHRYYKVLKPITVYNAGAFISQYAINDMFSDFRIEGIDSDVLLSNGIIEKAGCNEGLPQYKAVEPVIVYKVGAILTQFDLNCLKWHHDVDIDSLMQKGYIEDTEAPSVEYFVARGDSYSAIRRYQEIWGCDFDTADEVISCMNYKHQLSRS